MIGYKVSRGNSHLRRQLVSIFKLATIKPGAFNHLVEAYSKHMCPRITHVIDVNVDMGSIPMLLQLLYTQ